MKPLVLYHANCFDGFCAAWVAHKLLGDIEAVPVQYGQPPPDVTGREVYVLDFSYARGHMLLMAGKCHSLTILDHHKTVAEALDKLAEECARSYGLTQRVEVVFDLSKSGGRLAWEYFFGLSASAPWLVDYTEDRDLWRWKLPNSRQVNAALRSYPMSFGLWDDWEQMTRDDRLPLLTRLADEGGAILRSEQQIVEAHVRNAREVQLAGHKVLQVNATTLFSEIAGVLAKGRPFGACYFDRQDGKRQWSLRSDENGVDVSEIAKRYGGGGHKHAAGFEAMISDLPLP